MSGRRNSVSLSTILDRAVKRFPPSSSSCIFPRAEVLADRKNTELQYVDLHIQFIGALRLPRMGVVSSTHPYFVAKLDDKLSFVSTVKLNTITPVWNEVWDVKNVPMTASLQIEVLNKHNGALRDGHIGKFQTTVTSGVKEAEIRKPPLRRRRGTFWLKIDTSPSVNPETHPYLFDGPIRYSRHSSFIVGRFTNLDEIHLYSTWKIYLKYVPLFFGDNALQHWSRDYKPAQSIFQGPTSLAVRSGIQAGHRMMYARSTTNEFGVINEARDLLHILHGEIGHPEKTKNTFTLHIKPSVYTYVLTADDDSFRFSETGAAFFVDFASKHALHANCAESVRYGGEFHLRPTGGWDKFNDNSSNDGVKWELVIDNASGTYAPDPALLPNLHDLFEYNFPELGILALSHENPERLRSREACMVYAASHRGIKPALETRSSSSSS